MPPFWAYLLLLFTIALLVRISRLASERKSAHKSLLTGNGGLCVITGGGSGLGEALAHEYAALGYPLLLIGRKYENLKRAKHILTEKFGEKASVTILAADLEVESECIKVVEYLHDKNVFHLVNNAGVGQISADISVSDAHSIASINLTAPAVLSTGIRASRYIFISSPQGLLPMPNRCVYAASKAGIHNLAESMRLDGMNVTTAYPGWIATSLRMNARGNAFPNPQARSARSAEDVAKEIVSAALSGKRVCCLDTKIRIVVTLYSIWPEAAEFLIKCALK
ncbi:Short-chain dehydrogenase, putative [Giardia lamblia P15]|uniref:Short-chain dehydrogenase, putative n=1 Tax=Giardia intestinalis (strain P15) TaxID=658858 RepID=E1EWV2_GIAIA|nr:Short-chain dehydrogenase, putative [Giardia lamblia P15]